MGRNLESIFLELKALKDKELEKCNKELTSGIYNNVVTKALVVYKHELLESLEMYDLYLENKETIFV